MPRSPKRELRECGPRIKYGESLSLRFALHGMGVRRSTQNHTLSNLAAKAGVPFLYGRSGQQSIDDMSVHVGQPKITALMPIRQSLVIKTEAMENRRLQIMDMHLVLHDVEAEVVRLSVRDAALDPTAG